MQTTYYIAMYSRDGLYWREYIPRPRSRRDGLHRFELLVEEGYKVRLERRTMKNDVIKRTR